MVESVASSKIVCQCLWMVAVNDLPMFKKGVMMGRMFVNVWVLFVGITRDCGCG